MLKANEKDIRKTSVDVCLMFLFLILNKLITWRTLVGNFEHKIAY